MCRPFVWRTPAGLGGTASRRRSSLTRGETCCFSRCDSSRSPDPSPTTRCTFYCRRTSGTTASGILRSSAITRASQCFLRNATARHSRWRARGAGSRARRVSLACLMGGKTSDRIVGSHGPTTAPRMATSRWSAKSNSRAVAAHSCWRWRSAARSWKLAIERGRPVDASRIEGRTSTKGERGSTA